VKKKGIGGRTANKKRNNTWEKKDEDEGEAEGGIR